MWRELVVALALVLVIEGILPFLNPQAWRKLVLNVAQLNDGTLRLIGLVSMLAGIALLYLVQ